MMMKPAKDTLTYKGVKVAVAFGTGDVADDVSCCTIFPMFGGSNASKAELDKYNKACRVVIKRLKKLGFAVEE